MVLVVCGRKIKSLQGIPVNTNSSHPLAIGMVTTISLSPATSCSNCYWTMGKLAHTNPIKLMVDTYLLQLADFLVVVLQLLTKRAVLFRKSFDHLCSTCCNGSVCTTQQYNRIIQGGVNKSTRSAVEVGTKSLDCSSS